jgi:hypothetical protein
MIVESVKFRGHRCFKKDWSGFDTIKPINVIIGRNNTGKSHLLDLVEVLCGEFFYRTGKEKGWEYRCKGKLEEGELKPLFPDGKYIQGHFGGLFSVWTRVGQFLVGKEMTWEVDKSTQIIGNPTLQPIEQQINGVPFQGLDLSGYQLLHGIALTARHKLAGKKFRRLLAERDIRPQAAANDLNLSPNGEGATNIIRRNILSSSPRLSRELIQSKLLAALNEIFGSDGRFNEIEAKIHDEGNTYGHPVNSWEIFLGEDKKGLIALSRSGSGLRTIILVLLNLLVIPNVEGVRTGNYVYAFEELENNLHPALLRRLFKYLETYATQENATIFLTTHSSVALDFFGTSTNAQIIHVTHNGETAKAEPISAHFDQLGVISELGAKPSDLLQANGIIWVEGPSDRIYLNRWIELFSDGKFREGRDYQCAFYGGALLARTQFTSPEVAEGELVNLFRVNPNIVVVCDGDRTAETGEGSTIKARVGRIKDEVGKIPNAHIWITDAKEIENYLPGSVLDKAFKQSNLPNPDRFGSFFPSESGAGKTSYLENHLNRKTVDKIELASETCPHMSKEVMLQRFDLAQQITEIITKIRTWNS